MTIALSLFVSVFYRSAQALLESAPTLLCGLIVAGILRRMLTPSDVRRLFGAESWSALPRAWGLGMLLPVCSFGVLPIIVEMRRCGVRNGTILAFALAAPLLNPLSFLYGLTLSEPIIVFSFVLGSLIVSVAAGMLWDRFFDRTSESANEINEMEPQPGPGGKRMLAIFVTAARDVSGPVLRYCIAGWLCAGLLSAVLPAGSLQHAMSHDDPLSPLLMAAIGIPAFVSPMKAMMIVGLMFEHGNSIGAAYVLLVLGAGVNMGLFLWVWISFRDPGERLLGVPFSRRTVVWFALVTGLTLALAYAIESPLYLSPRQENHTHAFDDFTAAFAHSSGMHAFGEAWLKIKERTTAFEAVSLAGLGLLLVVGLALRRSGRDESLEAWLCRRKPIEGAGSVWNMALSPRLLGIFSLIGLAIFAVVGAYVYYPAPDSIFLEMDAQYANAMEATRNNRPEEALRALRRMDDLSRKLQVGVFLRNGGDVPAAASAAADSLRETMEEIHDGLAEDNLDESARHEKASELREAYRRCRLAFQKSG